MGGTQERVEISLFERSQGILRGLPVRAPDAGMVLDAARIEVDPVCIIDDQGCGDASSEERGSRVDVGRADRDDRVEQQARVVEEPDVRADRDLKRVIHRKGELRLRKRSPQSGSRRTVVPFRIQG